LAIASAQEQEVDFWNMDEAEMNKIVGCAKKENQKMSSKKKIELALAR
jgi:hypothetical protein